MRKAQSVAKGEAILQHARELHPGHADIIFNLACYASIMGRTEEAKSHLRQAIALDADIRQLALVEPDLQPLRDWIAGLKENH